MLNSATLSRYIIRQTEGQKLHRQKLVKLLFLFDMTAIHTKDYGESLTELTYTAEANGPVPANLEAFMNTLTARGDIVVENDFLIGQGDIDLEDLEKDLDMSPSQLEIVSNVLGEFAESSWQELSDFSHGFPAWFNTKQGQVIDPSLMHLAFWVSEPELAQ